MLPNTIYFEEMEQMMQRSLDPENWEDFRKDAHSMLDDIIGYIERVAERPVWQPIPEEIRARFREPLPQEPESLGSVHERFMNEILPHSVGNVHPGFMGWVHGGGTPVGMLAEMLAAGLNANLGGRDQIPLEVERQVLSWTRQLFGFPDSASGIFVTGTSMANFISILAARFSILGEEARMHGIGGRKLAAYASSSAHVSISRALDFAGIGSDALRKVPVNRDFEMDVDALRHAIEADRREGFTPFFVAATAGTVDTGAIDPLPEIAEIASGEGVWFHVDGACGALGMLSPEISPKLSGIELADYIAFDFHKWGQVPYDAGFVLVKDGELHRQAFASGASYLSRGRALSAGSPWPCDFGPDLSRGFRALKAWFTIRVHGSRKIGQSIAHTCELARHLVQRIEESDRLELLAPCPLNIVCFRYRCNNPDPVNLEIVARLQETGIAAPSTARIEGKLAIRAAIVNHRTRIEDIDRMVDAVLSIGKNIHE